MAQPNGLDVSEYQGTIDWNALYNNTAFVIIKATEGTGVVDGQFARNRDEARRVGMPRGFYHFARAGNANAEADHFVDSLGALQPGEWLVLDWEVHYADPVGWCLNWVERVKQRTLTSGPIILYMNVSTLNGYDWSPVWSAGAYLWIANPSGLPVSHDPIMTQYGYTTAPGIAGEIDGDTFNADNMGSFTHYGYTPPTPPQPQKPFPAPPSVTPETPPTAVKTPPQPQQGRAYPVQKPNKLNWFQRLLKWLHL